MALFLASFSILKGVITTFIMLTVFKKHVKKTRFLFILSNIHARSSYQSFTSLKLVLYTLNLFRMDPLGAAHGWGEQKDPPLLKICHTYPTMMKPGIVIPYPRRIQKTYKSRDTPLEICWHQHFSAGNQ